MPGLLTFTLTSLTSLGPWPPDLAILDILDKPGYSPLVGECDGFEQNVHF